jgi:hypothetical protein
MFFERSGHASLLQAFGFRTKVVKGVDLHFTFVALRCARNSFSYSSHVVNPLASRRSEQLQFSTTTAGEQATGSSGSGQHQIPVAVVQRGNADGQSLLSGDFSHCQLPILRVHTDRGVRSPSGFSDRKRSCAAGGVRFHHHAQSPQPLIDPANGHAAVDVKIHNEADLSISLSLFDLRARVKGCSISTHHTMKLSRL